MQTLLREGLFTQKADGAEVVLVSPDAGATKKVLDVARSFTNKFDVVRADKVRNTSTGQITSTKIYGEVLGKCCVILDDICDGGRTFTELATVLKRKGAAKVILYVTHGIFSKGTQILLDSGIDLVYTNNIWDEQELGEYVIKV
jgi:ribose-phosphate pyrophosphokinase